MFIADLLHPSIRKSQHIAQERRPNFHGLPQVLTQAIDEVAELCGLIQSMKELLRIQRPIFASKFVVRSSEEAAKWIRVPTRNAHALDMSRAVRGDIKPRKIKGMLDSDDERYNARLDNFTAYIEGYIAYLEATQIIW